MFFQSYVSAKIAIYIVLSAHLRTFNLIFLNFYRKAATASLIRRIASTIFSSLVA